MKSILHTFSNGSWVCFWRWIQTRRSYSHMFFKLCALKNFVYNINKKTPVLKSLFKKVASLKTCIVKKKRFQHRCFPVNIAKFLRTAFLQNTSSSCFWQTYKNKTLYLYPFCYLSIPTLEIIAWSARFSIRT